MAERLVLDPVTRIEGHLRIEASVGDGQVTEAWASGTMFRGMELVLQGRDPRDAWLFTQRICGVCTTVHALASVRAVEDALGITIPPNARLIRHLIAAAQNVHDHVIHFYILHALDWVDVSSALAADPEATAALSRSITDWDRSGVEHFAAVQQRVQKLVDSGQPGFLGSAYWGHPAYRLPPEANLLAVSHYLDALEFQRRYIRLHAILGAKNPHIQTLLVGGVAHPVDPNSQNALNADELGFIASLAEDGLDFVRRVYIPDLLLVAPFYKEWAGIGAGVGNYLSYGDFALEDFVGSDSVFLPAGRIVNRDLSQVLPVDMGQVSEYVTRSWYDYAEGDAAAVHPSVGETRPHYTGPEAPYSYLNVDEKYSWIKAPRYEDVPYEVGPLARMLVAYASGHQRVRELVDLVLSTLEVGPEALFSTLGRTAARGIEALLMAEKMGDWVNELAANVGAGDLRIHAGSQWDPSTWPKEAVGFGSHEAPRGALGHWVRIADGKIANYQCVVPTTWNASPRDAQGQPGPYELSLVGTPLADPERPLEILRTIHSFDPCLACAVHLLDATGKVVAKVTTQ
ncbi:MAG: nickel-dependent hydrogenase large subunit [Anaerolineae bacterium]|nr:nickel-dependent hydrogenase large subunit [Anaerolineae bacterium]